MLLYIGDEDESLGSFFWLTLWLRWRLPFMPCNISCLLFLIWFML